MCRPRCCPCRRDAPAEAGGGRGRRPPQASPSSWRSRVEPSISVKRNVTVPPGSTLMRVSVWSRSSERSRTGSSPLESAHPDLHRDLRRGARHRDRQRRAPDDPARPALRGAEPPMGDHRLRAHVRRVPPPRRTRGRPDRAPHRLHVGLGIFGAASLVCGLSSSSGMLIAARGVQGFGAAIVHRRRSRSSRSRSPRAASGTRHSEHGARSAAAAGSGRSLAASSPSTSAGSGSSGSTSRSGRVPVLTPLRAREPGRESTTGTT